VNTMMHFEAEIKDALGGHDRWSLEMHQEAVVDRVCRCTGRPRSRELRDALRGRDRLSLKMHREAEVE